MQGEVSLLEAEARALPLGEPIEIVVRRGTPLAVGGGVVAVAATEGAIVGQTELPTHARPDEGHCQAHPHRDGDAEVLQAELLRTREPLCPELQRTAAPTAELIISPELLIVEPRGDVGQGTQRELKACTRP